MEFKDSVVVVTGGTRGIGRAITLAFAREGARVVAAYLSNDEAAGALVRDAGELPGTVEVIRADVATSAGAQEVINAAAGTGHIDVLVNNAGIIRDCYLAMMSDEDWDAVIRSNVNPLFHCCKWGLRKMMGRRSGCIINISSVSALLGTSGQANYAASKGAAISFTRSLAREAGPMGIRVNAVAAGMIDTDMTAGLKQEVVDRVVKGAALGRIGKPEEVASAVLFLASQRASYVTGQSLVVDGGIL
ncbi:3-oxoacyl-ACP reductase family protein [Geobacter sp. SVR]|uniref:3-oxoacyl-ACP reductase family protein n=1 Tax=Geobacter sp. SVR TaxID=2495594 RepID=UPI00143EFDC5|nr:3-oxoacyl-ACP reductase family protein [Geobacter sp. SVR]BCS54297.1 3-oxoacyl-ACP reductase [Geobacter sp. SVR]GCF85844.1 3-oxoacyl-ACP reductase [Geobacter sp. SVR]